jgi:ribonucleoside-diphosphate reductase beta chain
MILAAFSNTETIHIAACSHRLDTIGMPELEYQAFFRYEKVKDKFDFMQTFRIVSSHEITKTLAEGLQLQKNPQIWIAQLQQDITGICATIVDHEDAFIGLARLYHLASNSLPWLDDMLTPWSAI